MTQDTNVDSTRPAKGPRFVPVYLRQSAVKKLIRLHGKQCSTEFLMVLDSFVGRKVEKACAVHDGGGKRLNTSIAAYVGIA